MNNSEYIICYNCKRKINIKDLKEVKVFKCSSCFNTLIVNDPFYEIKNKLIQSRNRWIILGMILGLLPMIFIMFFISKDPITISIFNILIVILILISTIHFKKKFSDIIIGIVFCEIGIYNTIMQYILNNFSKEEYIKNIPDLRLQTNFFLLFGIILIILGLLKRKNYILL